MKKIYVILILLTCFSTLYAQVPVVSSFSPAKGGVGTVVTITGSNFNTTAASNVVYFGTNRATVTSATATQLTVIAPAASNNYLISVLNLSTALTGYSTSSFSNVFPSKTATITTADFDTHVEIGTAVDSKIKAPQTVYFADLDGDGAQDMIICNSGANNASTPFTYSLSIMLNSFTKGGTFSASSFGTKINMATSQNTNSTTGIGPFCVAVGDLDGDGKPDMVVCNYAIGTLSIYRNTSTGVGNISFTQVGSDLPTPAGPKVLVIGDYDKDGKPDIAVTCASASKVCFFPNKTPTGGTILFTGAHTDVTTPAGNVILVQGDIDGDGKIDIATANVTANSISAIRNTSVPGTISFDAAVSYNFALSGVSPTTPYAIAIGDLDGDGKPELVAGGYNSAGGGGVTNNVVIYRNATTTGVAFTAGSFTTSTLPSTNHIYGITLADLDGDGKLDVLTDNLIANNVGIFHNTTASANNLSFDAPIVLTSGGSGAELFVCDMDGDGKPDIASANVGQTSVSLFHNARALNAYYSKATGDLSSLATYGTAIDGTGTAPTDFNGAGTSAIYQLSNRSSYVLTSDLAIGTTLNVPISTSLDLGGQTLTTGTLSGLLAGSTTSSLTVNGTLTGLSFATGKEQLNKLTLGASATVTLASALNIASTGSVTLGASSTLTTGGYLTLKSDLSGTAQIPALGSGATISGKVTVERYLADKRSWRLISSPVNSTQTINAAWQEGAASATSDPNPGYGTLIIGGSTANGFDIASSSSSLLVYNGSAFTNAPNTTTLGISSNTGYFLFSIGSRAVSPTTAGAHSATVLRNTGTVLTGTQTANVTGAGYTLVNNPYPAPLDFSQLTRSATVPNQFYAWDINLGTYGGYVLVSNSGGSYTSVPTSPSGLNNIIPSGGAIFVQSDGTTAGTITANESSKAVAAGSAGFNKFNVLANNSNIHNIRVNLTDANTNLVDGVMASFAPNYANKVDADDASKLPNFYENISLTRSGKLLTLERRSDLLAKDTIFIQLSGVKATSYKLQVDPNEFNEPGTIAYLQDAYLHTSTKLDLTQVSNINFATTADTTSYKNRFSINFIPVTPSIAKISHIGASVVAYPNPAVQKQINLSFDGLPTGTYNITVMNTFGQVMQKNSMTYNGSTPNKQLTADYSTGVYTVNIQAAGYNQSIKVIIP